MSRSREESRAEGRLARLRLPFRALCSLAPEPPARDPVAVLEAQGANRLSELLPIRYGRMSSSPFAFFRGGAALMAMDLAASEHTGLEVQLCGDAHLLNFGVFAGPDRRLLFDINDFDETLCGPWEWDLKRLAASLEVAGLGRGFTPKQRRTLVRHAAAAYRTTMARFATRSNLDVWYARLDIESEVKSLRKELLKSDLARTHRSLGKARTRNSLTAFKKLTRTVDGVPRFVSDPPLIVTADGLVRRDEVFSSLRSLLKSYRGSLPHDRRHLISQYEPVDIARKVVGIGSVGTRSWILLLLGNDGADPLVLQAKEAQASVLEAHLGADRFGHHGQRVVAGQQLMQAAGDIVLGWGELTGLDGVRRSYYVRQLWDAKRSYNVEKATPSGFAQYAALCGWTLARAHARSGDRLAISSYLGEDDSFDRALSDFAVAYRCRNAADYARLLDAIESGAVVATPGI